MKKNCDSDTPDDLRKAYDLKSLRGVVRGKYYRRATAGTNLVLIDSDLAKAFPDSDSVNRALRLMLETAQAAAPKRGKPKPT